MIRARRSISPLHPRIGIERLLLAAVPLRAATRVVDDPVRVDRGGTTDGWYHADRPRWLAIDVDIGGPLRCSRRHPTDRFGRDDATARSGERA